MTTFLYRCPVTGYQVQGWADDNPQNEAETYQAVTCLACGRVHLVDPKTGKTPSDVSGNR